MGSIESEEMKSRNYMKWDASGFEVIPPNEQEDIQAIADQINAIQQAQFNTHRHCFGGTTSQPWVKIEILTSSKGTHARAQRLVKGEMVVGGLPPHLAQSMFSRPKTYPIVMRYGTEPGDPALDDRIPQPRGLGMKVFNVHGERFDGKELSTQDIEFNSTPALDLADAKTTKEIIDLRIKYGGDKAELYRHLEVRKDTALQKARDEVRNTHLESTRQYSQTAYRFGDYVVRYCLVPSSETQKKLYEETVKPDAHPDNILSEWLKEFHTNHDAGYLFRVQLLENLEDQPIEYAGKV
ncbi:uncharacterized protein EAF01_005547 [Botrytis porri]|uniref:uncharacterized protein n=1 Tax=Botrytis porri TaxID=87229 RepID=UPI0018FF59C8|nr:uncharacterized protein EAF01_005547 [Botrytis porri]KAF7905025.1 hypothetical protein EAF01_005547 [Botrytis porri]